MWLDGVSVFGSFAARYSSEAALCCNTRNICHKQTPSRYDWKTVESDVKHHSLTHSPFVVPAVLKVSHCLRPRVSHVYHCSVYHYCTCIFFLCFYFRFQGYGMTEVGVTHVNSKDQFKNKAVGKLCPLIEMKVHMLVWSKIIHIVNAWNSVFISIPYLFLYYSFWI